MDGKNNSEGPFHGKARYHPALTLHHTINYKALWLNSGRLGETLVHLSYSLYPVIAMGPQHREATALDSLTGCIFELAPIVYLKSREDDRLQRQQSQGALGRRRRVETAEGLVMCRHVTAHQSLRDGAFAISRFIPKTHYHKW